MQAETQAAGEMLSGCLAPSGLPGAESDAIETVSFRAQALIHGPHPYDMALKTISDTFRYLDIWSELYYAVTIRTLQAEGGLRGRRYRTVRTVPGQKSVPSPGERQKIARDCGGEGGFRWR